MDLSSVFEVLPLVLGIVGAVMLLLGMILLLTGIANKKKKPNAVTKIAVGIALTIVSFVLFLITFVLVLVKLTYVDTVNTDEVVEIRNDMEKALESDDPEEFSELFAEESVRGDRLTPDDADELFEVFDGSVTDADISINSVQKTNGDVFLGMRVIVDTRSEKTYIMNVYYALDYHDSDCEGIQYIHINSRGRTLYDAGTMPYDED